MLRFLREYESAQVGDQVGDIAHRQFALGHDAGHGAAAARDDDFLTLDDLVYDGGEVGLGFGKGQGSHGLSIHD